MSREEREFYSRLCQLVEDLHLVMVEMRRNINTIESTFLIGANRVSVDVAAGSSSGAGQQPTTVANSLLGWSLREPSGANPATVILRDGANADADEVAAVTLAAGASVRDQLPAGGVALINGLFLDVTAGEVVGAVYLRNT